MLRMVAAEAVWGLEEAIIAQFLVEDGLEISESDENELLAVLKGATGRMPRWTNNGWTDAEISEQGLEQGQLFTGEQIWPQNEQEASSGARDHQPGRELTSAEQERIDKWFDLHREDSGEYDIDMDIDEEAISLENEQLLEGFHAWLTNRGLSDATIYRHMDNVNFFLDFYLLNYCGKRAVDGVIDIWSFQGDWFIRKAMWSSPTGIKSNAASFKKFYRYLEEDGIAEPGTYRDVCDMVKAGLPDWLKSYDDYMNQSYDYW